MIKPLIKYTGGKFKEYEIFKDFIPNKINNYYEPFLGGGGVMFQLINNKKVIGKCFGNDISSDLILFYKNVNNKKLLVSLMKTAKCWNEMKQIASFVYDKIGYEFYGIISKEKSFDELTDEKIMEIINEVYSTKKTLNEYDYHNVKIIETLINELKSKLLRFYKKEKIENLGLNLVCDCIETAILQGFYFVIRELYNECRIGNSDEFTIEERCTYWYFIRELAFGGMFRFSKDGRFNIPYGGKTYNDKCIDCKVFMMAEKEIQDAFKKIEFFNEDFEKFMNKEYEEDDFIFLDPPYDSTFTEYDDSEFGRDEHIRLRDILVNLKTKWLLVIRKTEFIEKLYDGFIKSEFKKTYKYQAKGTYDSKESTHLIITNYKNIYSYD